MSQSGVLNSKSSTPPISNNIGFVSYRSTDIPNVTGDTTFVNPICDITVQNSGSYDTVTGIFTAPQSGYYLFTFINSLYNSSAEIINSAELSSKIITTSNTYNIHLYPASLDQINGGINSVWGIGGSGIIYLDSGDTAILNISGHITGVPALNLGIRGLDGTDYNTMFSGKLI